MPNGKDEEALKELYSIIEGAWGVIFKPLQDQKDENVTAQRRNEAFALLKAMGLAEKGSIQFDTQPQEYSCPNRTTLEVIKADAERLFLQAEECSPYVREAVKRYVGVINALT